MSETKIRFRDYKNYPNKIMDAARFRDSYDDLPDGAFFVVAEEKGIDFQGLVDWEWENTDAGLEVLEGG